jgi:lantibiotic modifying enzyme
LNLAESQRQQDLLGFSHGTAGIGWVLLELYQATGEELFRHAADEAFRYERHWFSPSLQNWPDFRGLYEATGSEQPQPGHMVAWCHGAAGVGLARLRAYALVGDPRYREEAEIALRTTAQMLETSMVSGQVNFSLCHGLGGNAELFLIASQVLQDENYFDQAVRVGKYGAAHFHDSLTPWPCGVMGAGESPGLFLGIAGIGYFYLRLYDLAQIPSIMLVTPDA